MKVWRFLLLMSAAIVLFGAGLLAFNFLIMPRLVHRNTVVLVPDLRGSTIAGAQVEAQKLDLRIVETHQRPDPTVPRGVILEQEPAPAKSIRTGRMIEVVTSSGPPAGALPELVGLSRRQAEITLQRESYRLGRILRVRRADATMPTVVFQYPPAGDVLRKGQPVDLVVAEPTLPAVYCMPDLRGASLYDAQREIAASGCVNAPVSFERSRDVPPNIVLSQTPPPGERIRKGARIELVASTR